MRAMLIPMLLLLTLSPIHAADKPPLEVTAELGFANHFSNRRPFPFTLDLSGAQREISGSVRVSTPNVVGGETVLESPIALSPGAHKRWRFTLPPIVSKSVEVQVYDRKGALLCEQEFFGMPVPDNAALVLIVQDEAAGRFTLPRAANDKDINGAWRAASIPLEALPEDALAYAGVSAVVWRMDKPKALSDAQGVALAQWLKQGGLLVVAGGRNTPPNLPRDCRFAARWGEMESFEVRGFADARMDSTLRPVALLARQRTGQWDTRSFPESKIAIRPLIVDSARPRMRVGDRHFLTEQSMGGGVIAQMAFDPHDLVTQGIPLGIDFWEQVLWLPDARRSPWTALEWLTNIARDSSREQLAQVANYRVQSVWRIAWVFGAFFGVAFGLNFLLFRKSRRYEWAWLILLVASIGLFLYNRAFGRVGGFGPTRHVEITRSYGVAGERSLTSFTEVGLLAPTTRDTRIATTRPHQILLGCDSVKRHVVNDGAGQTYPVRLRAGAFNTCSSVAEDELPGDGIDCSWSQKNGAIEIHLVNKTKSPLLNARVFPTGASMRTEGNDEFFVKISTAMFQQWMLNLPGIQIVTPTKRDDCTCPSSSGWSLRNRFGSSSYYVNGPSITAMDEGMEQSHFLFRFELPETSTPLTKSDASNVRCHRTVSLLIPITAALDPSTPPQKVYSGKDRFQ